MEDTKKVYNWSKWISQKLEITKEKLRLRKNHFKWNVSIGILLSDYHSLNIWNWFHIIVVYDPMWSHCILSILNHQGHQIIQLALHVWNDETRHTVIIFHYFITSFSSLLKQALTQVLHYDQRLNQTPHSQNFN